VIQDTQNALQSPRTDQVPTMHQVGVRRWIQESGRTFFPQGMLQV